MAPDQKTYQHVQHVAEQSSGVSKGRPAVADVLQQALPHNNRPAALKLASECIDAWLLASNPVGEPETIYDEFYRLREAARWVVLMWDAERSMHPAMGELRTAIGLPRERPAREAAEARLDAVVEGEFRWP